MTDATSSRHNGDRWNRDENRYLDPASERYATQLAAVVFGWGTWTLDANPDDGAPESSRAAAELSARREWTQVLPGKRRWPKPTSSLSDDQISGDQGRDRL
jgi:hypothetical protein